MLMRMNYPRSPANLEITLYVLPFVLLGIWLFNSWKLGKFQKKKSRILALVVIVIFATVSCVWYFTSKSFRPNWETTERDIVRVYMFRDSEETMKPNFILFENGTFQMSFSGVSSYIGVGTYSLENDRLTLKTDDGDFVYCFDAVDDTYVFDASASSDMVWFSDMYDGCVFY